MTLSSKKVRKSHYYTSVKVEPHYQLDHMENLLGHIPLHMAVRKYLQLN